MALKIGKLDGVIDPAKVPSAAKALGTHLQHAAKELGVDYQQHLQSKPVTGMVSSSKAVKGEEIAGTLSQTQMLHKGVFSDGMSISIEGGRVINLGNYETARIAVTITVPCTKDTLDDAYQFGTEWVSSKIEEAVAAAKA